MSEKQASSEIAQSRERFEKFFNRQELGHQLISNVRKIACWETYQQAVRDTRERVSQIAKDIAKEVGGNFADTHRLNVGLNKFIRELERIRGKE